MSKKDKDSILDEYEKLRREIVREKVNDIFSKHPKDYISKLEEIGFVWVDDEYDPEEIEERNARPENQRQRKLVDYFENRREFSKNIFDCFCEEKADEAPNFALVRKYFKIANQNLKFLILYGLENYPQRIDLLDDLTFFHEFQNMLEELINYYTRACMAQENLETFAELAQNFHFATMPDGYEAYHALRELFAPGTSKRCIIDALIQEESDEQRLDI